MVSRDSLTRVLDVLHEAQNDAKALILLSTDSEKAFDWVFMEMTFQHIGISGQMLLWIKTL